MATQGVSIVTLRRSRQHGVGTRSRFLAFLSVALLAFVLALGMASPTMAAGDTEGDVLSDYTEVTFTYTNPLDWDTDGNFVNDRLDRYPLDSARW